MTSASTPDLRAAVDEIVRGFDLLDRVLGPMVRQIREQAGVSQRELARRWGVGNTWLGRWENGKTSISHERLSVLAERWDYLLDPEPPA